MAGMCRLFGFKSAVLSRAHRSLVEAENALSQQARMHPDGWGIAWFQGGQAWIVKSELGASDSESFRRASAHLASNTMIAHVRRATVGSTTPNNTHPFRCGRWVFAHNGTLFDFERLRDSLVDDLPPPLRHNILGTTDTETLFHWLLAQLVAAGLDLTRTPPAERVLPALRDARERLLARAEAAGCRSPVINFLLTDGTLFVAQRYGRELYMATQKVACADAGTCAWADKICLLPERPGNRLNHLLVASERIGDEDRWEEVPEGAILAVGEDLRLLAG